MADRDRAGLARARRFGLEIGAGCLALSAWFLWRGTHPAARVALLAAGAVLLAAALVRPALLRGISAAWLAFGERLAAITTPLFVSILYVLVVTPVGLLRRTVSRSPIHRDRGASTYWKRREPATPAQRRAAMEHQF